MAERRWRLAAALGLAMVVLAALSMRPTTTDASWTSTQQGAATAATLTVPPPSVNGCAGVALSASVTISWTLPAGGQYTTADIAFGASSSGLGTLGQLLGANTSATTGPVNGVYTTTVSSTLLTGLLGSVLGETIYISLWTMYKPSSGVSSSWVSTPVGYKVTYPLVLGVLGGTCSSA